MRPTSLAPATPPRDDLAAWLTRTARDHALVDLELEAGDGEDARTIYAATWSPSRDPAATLAAELRAAASAHGELQAGPVVYMLRARIEGAESRTPLRVAGPHAGGPLATGAPADLVATAQRHAETAHALSMRTLAAASDAIRALAVEVRERAASDQDEIRYWRERSKALREEHDAVTRERTQVELESAIELERERRMSQIAERATALLGPAIAKRLAPAPAKDGATKQEAAPMSTVKRAWSQLSDDTIARIAADLPPDLAMEVVQALGSTQDPEGE